MMKVQIMSLIGIIMMLSHAARGEGEGIEKFSEGTRRRWRSKAVDWLLADEAVKRATFDADPIGYRQRTRIHILRWHIDPALQTLRSMR